MWWEIVPSFALITTLMTIPSLATRAMNRAAHDGNPYHRCYTDLDGFAVFHHRRDTQHGKPSFWQKYIMEDKQGNATVYKTNTLADL